MVRQPNQAAHAAHFVGWRAAAQCTRGGNVRRQESHAVVVDNGYTTQVDSLLKEMTMSSSTWRALSNICFVGGFVSIVGSIAIWFLTKEPDPAHGERFGIFVGLWAPTFFALSSRLEQYAAAKVTGS